MDPSPDAASYLILATIVVTLGYIASCVWFPFADCRWCGGHGRKGPSKRMRRHCRWCDHTGLRLRIGRRIWNYLARSYRNAR